MLLIACLIALSSALAAKRPPRLASGLSHSSRINNFDLMAREKDFDICFRGWCFECDSDEPCSDNGNCDGDDDFCINGYCCEPDDQRCRCARDCDDDEN
ncbi:hypothetical protein FHG87_014307 [Trinorchestia longiramus]|nr:hypothetical protein FHG87_014307 [Trinorchestia longiramus]